MVIEMKAEELATQLRIGNLLYYKGTTHIAKVELIHNKHFDCRDEYGGFTPNGDYEPIPLSEEVLLKCGFEKTYYGFKYHGVCVLYFVIKNNEVYLGYFDDDDWCRIGKPIKYLHQIQNLTHSLTGEELEVSI